MSSGPLERVYEIVEDLSLEYNEHRVQIDELNYLLDLCEDQLPQLFVELVRNARDNIGTTTSGFQVRRERLSCILAVATKFPKPKILGAGGDLLPTFELSEPDKERVLKLCSGMRKIILASEDFDDPHKKRLLNRIAAIEQQVHSPKGLFDVVLGGVSDIGETLGKFGKDVKPLTDRIAEVKRITRRSASAYDQLPEPEELKKLPAPDEMPPEE